MGDNLCVIGGTGAIVLTAKKDTYNTMVMLKEKSSQYSTNAANAKENLV